MKKRMLSMLLAIVMVITLLPTMALAEEGHTHLVCQTANCTLDHNGSEEGTGHSDADKVTFVEWTDALAAAQNGNGKTAANSLPAESGTYYLTADVTLSNTWTVPVGDGVTLCLNGHSITKTKITVASGGSLTITDCDDEERQGYIDANYLWNAGETVPGGATECDLTGGIINSDKSGYYVGDCVVSIEGGAFTLYGGNLSGSKCEPVLVASGTFTMYGGNITGNGKQGVNNRGTFTMNGGTISYNGARGVSVGGGEFTMNNGNITNNRIGSSSDGGGVHVTGGKFTMNGGTISGNWAAGEGGGVYVYDDEFTMNGGTITNNEATRDGGGVCVSSGEFNMNGGIITGNTARRLGGGVYFSGDTFNLSGGIITGNYKGSESSAANNVELINGRRITVPRTLSAGTKIGVTAGLRSFTSGGAAYVNNFKSDNPAYRVDVDGNNLKLVDPPDHTISMAAPPENGAVQIPTTAGEGTTVTITATPAEGYEVDTVKYYNTADETIFTEVAVSNNTGTFIMPAYNVTISVTFKAIPYSITPAPTENGSFTVKVGDGTPTSAATTATAGETVTITATPNDGYAASRVIVNFVDQDGNGNWQDATPGDNNTYTFIMPELDAGKTAKIEVSFVKANLSVTCGNVTKYAENLAWAFEIADDLAEETDGAPVTIKVERDYTETINPYSEDIRIVDSSYNNPAITLDLNGKEIHFPETNLYYEDIGMLYITGYDLTLTDTSSEGDGIIHALVTVDGRNNFEEAALDAEPDYDLIVEGGTYRGFRVYTTDTIKISGGTFFGMPQEVVDEMREDSFASGYAAIIGTKGLLLSNNGGFENEDDACAALNDIIADGYAASKDYEITVFSYEDVGETITEYYAGFEANTTIGRPITKAETTNGSFAVKVGEDEVKAAATGETVTITTTPNNGYVVDTVSVTKTAGGEAVEVSGTGNTRTFTMPAEAVTVSVTFKKIPAPAPAPTPSGGSSNPTYPVVENKREDPDGTVKFSSNYSTPGSTVTVTVTPDKYYGVEKVIVRNASGKELETTKNADGTYSFKMPYGKVTVEAVYVWENPFVDTKEGAYYINAVEWALKNGVTEGTSKTTFSPNSPCSRAQMMTFLWRAAGCPEPSGDVCAFTDVNMDSYYGKAVLWAVENGITKGTSATTFSPGSECSRAQMAAFLCRMADGKAESDVNTFADVKSGAYYAEAVQWAVENGITKGTSSNNYSPDATCTRGQMVTFLYRYYVK